MTMLRTTLLALSTAFALSACGSSQPSEAEAKAAISAEFVRLMGATVEVQDFQDFEVRNCRKAESTDDVVCDLAGAVVLTIAAPPNPPLHRSRAVLEGLGNVDCQQAMSRR